MKRFSVFGIDWDCFADPSHYDLPTDSIVECDDEDMVADTLSDEYGWCINSIESIEELDD